MKHGTLRAYQVHRCRCDACRAAKAAYQRAYRQGHREAFTAYGQHYHESHRGERAEYARRYWPMRHAELKRRALRGESPPVRAARDTETREAA